MNTIRRRTGHTTDGSLDTYLVSTPNNGLSQILEDNINELGRSCLEEREEADWKDWLALFANLSVIPIGLVASYTIYKILRGDIVISGITLSGTPHGAKRGVMQVERKPGFIFQ